MSAINPGVAYPLRHHQTVKLPLGQEQLLPRFSLPCRVFVHVAAPGCRRVVQRWLEPKRQRGGPMTLASDTRLHG